MNVDFNSIAKSRARYYLKSAPVQFVQVELLRMENAQSLAVTLTFKNIANIVLNSLNISYVCKDKSGNAVVQNNFSYTGLQVQEGEMFGSNDAVFVSEVPLSNVEVTILGAEYAGTMHNLLNCKAVPLPALKPMSAATADKTNRLLNIEWAVYIPCNVEDGWQCTCGAFNYNTGKSAAMCTECGVNKQALFNTVRSVINGVQVPQTANNSATLANNNSDVSKQGGIGGLTLDGSSGEFNAPVMSFDDFDNAANVQYSIQDPQQGGYNSLTENEQTQVIPTKSIKKESTVSLMKKETADAIMRFAPLVTIGAGSVYFIIILLIKMFS